MAAAQQVHPCSALPRPDRSHIRQAGAKLSIMSSGANAESALPTSTMLPAAVLPGAMPASLANPQSVADLVLKELHMAASSHPAEEALPSPSAVSGESAVCQRQAAQAPCSKRHAEAQADQLGLPTAEPASEPSNFPTSS